MVVFFDIDETLINQRQAEARAVVRLLEDSGASSDCHYPPADYCRLWRELREKHTPPLLAGFISVAEQRRRRMREFFCAAGRSLNNRETDDLIDRYESVYRDNWTLFDDVFPALRSLCGYRCGIISNGSTAQQKLKLERTGIAPFFDLILVSEDAGTAKPDRAIFLAACRRIGVSASHCCYVGDRLDHDVLGSRLAGMHPYWLRRGRFGRNTSIDVIGTLADLPWQLERRMAV